LKVADYRPNQKIYPNRRGRGPAPPENIRPLFLVKAKVSTWAILVIRVHWYTPEDGELAQSIAAQASKRLKTNAVCAFYDDVSDPYAQQWQNGKELQEWSRMDDDFYLKFYELGLAAPSSWPSAIDGQHVFMSKTPKQIERVDFLGLKEPQTLPTPAPVPESSTSKSTTAKDLLRQLADTLRPPPAKKPPKPRKRKK
jgi:hypothetical protein